MKTEEIEQLIKDGLVDADVYVEGDGTHFTALVVSSLFIGLSRLKKQQMVYDTVKTQIMDGSLHALSIKAMTPDEWQAIEKDENSWKN
jgi:acid stress-induced BolA-like protein IbaG/YrbA